MNVRPMSPYIRRDLRASTTSLLIYGDAWLYGHTKTTTSSSGLAGEWWFMFYIFRERKELS